ncbi:hypothetical protein ABID29_001873 [Streptococcus rupicaprae]|uniref:Uncharacterized protein n=1 Tax=Streptococcus rupicaprae TaxID=759619 RepID=A0ABV2FJJ3_9STRE
MKSEELLQAVDGLLDIMKVHGNGGFTLQQDMLEWLHEKLSSGIDLETIDKADFLRLFYNGKENFSAFHVLLDNKTEINCVNEIIANYQATLWSFLKADRS